DTPSHRLLLRLAGRSKRICGLRDWPRRDTETQRYFEQEIKRSGVALFFKREPPGSRNPCVTTSPAARASECVAAGWWRVESRTRSRSSTNGSCTPQGC